MASSTTTTCHVPLANLPSATAGSMAAQTPSQPPTAASSASGSTTAMTSTADASSASSQITQSCSPAAKGKIQQCFAELRRVCSAIQLWVLYLTIISLVIALLGLPDVLKATNDSHDSLKLAKWTAQKDYPEHCLAVKVEIRFIEGCRCLHRVGTPSFGPSPGMPGSLGPSPSASTGQGEGPSV
jgi:hypothetical protein